MDRPDRHKAGKEIVFGSERGKSRIRQGERKEQRVEGREQRAEGGGQRAEVRG
jgi:hypothetical protein